LKKHIKLKNKNMENRVGKIYFCEICKNEVKFEKDGGGQLFCCGQPMQEKQAKEEAN
jgi:desulfoferrodoxin-like iron-binding protein